MELILEIFKKLEPKELCAARSVSYSWHKIINDTELFYGAEFDLILSEAKATANTITDNYNKAEALIAIAKLDPLHDLTKAKAAANAITYTLYKTKALVKVAKVAKQLNLARRRPV